MNFQRKRWIKKQQEKKLQHSNYNWKQEVTIEKIKRRRRRRRKTPHSNKTAAAVVATETIITAAYWDQRQKLYANALKCVTKTRKKNNRRIE